MSASTAKANLAALIASKTATTTNAPAAKEKREAQKLYLNVGYDHPTLGRINLPFNLSLDSMQMREENKGTAEWRARMALSNKLLTELRTLVEQLDPGADGAFTIPGLTVQAYHNEAVAPTEDDAAAIEQALAAAPVFSFR